MEAFYWVAIGVGIIVIGWEAWVVLGEEAAGRKAESEAIDKAYEELCARYKQEGIT